MYPSSIFVYTKGLHYEDLNKFKIINNTKYLELCADKNIQNFASIVMCSNFSDFELTLYCLKKYYPNYFAISSVVLIIS